MGGPLVSVTKLADAAENGASGTFQFTRTGNLTQPLTVNVTVGGSATSGSDYVALPATVTFAANAATATLTVTPKSDNEFEDADNEVVDPETVVVTVASGTGYLPSGSAAVVSVTDDPPVVTTRVSWSPNSQTGELGHITVTRSGGDLTQPLTAWVEVSEELELDGYDVIPMMAMTVEFGANETNVTIDAVIDLVGPGDGSVPSVLLNGATSQPFRTDRFVEIAAAITLLDFTFTDVVKNIPLPLTYDEYQVLRSVVQMQDVDAAIAFGSEDNGKAAKKAAADKLADGGALIDWRTLPVPGGAVAGVGAVQANARVLAPDAWNKLRPQIAQWLVDLDDNAYAVRNAAKIALEKSLRRQIAVGDLAGACLTVGLLEDAHSKDDITSPFPADYRTLIDSILKIVDKPTDKNDPDFANYAYLRAYRQLMIEHAVTVFGNVIGGLPW